MENYEINEATLAILPISEYASRVIERSKEYIVDKNPFEIVAHSCEYFGSTYNGRFNGTKAILGFNYKSPIYIEEANDLLFFPTESPRTTTCCWIAYNNIVKIEEIKGSSKVLFKNGYELFLDISVYCLKNQYVRSMILQEIMRKRRKIS
jgi:competence protein ComK